jgi:hypothetical protein
MVSRELPPPVCPLISTPYFAGDFYPTTAVGRGAFIVYIPVSVVIMLRALDEVNEFIKHVRTVKTVEICEITDMLNMDQSGDHRVDLGEYIVYMLRASGHIDDILVARLESQFQRLDVTNDGVIGVEDFPPGIGLKKVHRDFNGRRTTEISVVAIPLPKSELPADRLAEDDRYLVQDKLRAARKEEQLIGITLQAKIDEVNRFSNELRVLCADAKTWVEMSEPHDGYKPIRVSIPHLHTEQVAEEPATSTLALENLALKQKVADLESGEAFRRLRAEVERLKNTAPAPPPPRPPSSPMSSSMASCSSAASIKSWSGEETLSSSSHQEECTLPADEIFPGEAGGQELQLLEPRRYGQERESLADADGVTPSPGTVESIEARGSIEAAHRFFV